MYNYYILDTGNILLFKNGFLVYTLTDNISVPKYWNKIEL